MDLRSAPQPGRAQCQLPAANQGLIDGEREENIRFSDIVVIEKIGDARFEIVDIERPILVRNCHAELIFGITLAAQRNECEILAVHKIQDRSRYRKRRRLLIKLTVKPAKGPVDARNAKSNSSPRARGLLLEIRIIEMSESNPTGQCKK